MDLTSSYMSNLIFMESFISCNGSNSSLFGGVAIVVVLDVISMINLFVDISIWTIKKLTCG